MIRQKRKGLIKAGLNHMALMYIHFHYLSLQASS